MNEKELLAYKDYIFDNLITLYPQLAKYLGLQLTINDKDEAKEVTKLSKDDFMLYNPIHLQKLQNKQENKSQSPQRTSKNRGSQQSSQTRQVSNIIINPSTQNYNDKLMMHNPLNEQTYQFMKYVEVIAQGVDQSFQVILQHKANVELKNQSPEKQTQDSNAFQYIRKTALSSLTKEEMEVQYNILLDKFQEKEDLTNILRKDYLKEVNHLRELSEMQIRGKLLMKGRDFLNVRYFSFMDGMDEKVCDVLNIKLQQVAENYNSVLAELDLKIKNHEDTIKKYKQLAPKTFKLMDLTLDEIFGSLYIIEQDAAKVWAPFIKAYPKGHFDGVIEDTYGTFLDDEAQNEIGRSVQKLRADSEKEVKKVSERLCTQIRELEFQLRSRIEENNKLREQFQYESQDQRDELKNNYESLLKEKELILKEKYQNDIKNHEYQAEKAKNLKDLLQKDCDSLQREVFILKLRMISKIVIKYKEDNKLDSEDQQLERNKLFFDKIKNLVLGSENSRLCAMLDLRKDMMKNYKDKYEKCAQELYDLKLKVNSKIDDSDNLRKKIGELQSASTATFSFLNTTRAELRKVKHERDILIDAQRASLGLVANLEAQKRQLEEKYNVNILKQRKQLQSYKTIQDKTMERFLTENNIVFNTSQLLISTDELKEMRKQTVQKVDSQVQTFLKNIEFPINYDTTGLIQQKQNVTEGTKIDQEVQTKVRLEQFDGFLKKREKEQEKLEKELAKYKRKNQKLQDTTMKKGPRNESDSMRSTLMGAQINFNSKNVSLKINTNKISNFNGPLSSKNSIKLNSKINNGKRSGGSSRINSNKSSGKDLYKDLDFSKRQSRVIAEEDFDEPQSGLLIKKKLEKSGFHKQSKSAIQSFHGSNESSFTDSISDEDQSRNSTQIKIQFNQKKQKVSQDSFGTDEENGQTFQSQYQTGNNSPYNRNVFSNLKANNKSKFNQEQRPIFSKMKNQELQARAENFQQAYSNVNDMYQTSESVQTNKKKVIYRDDSEIILLPDGNVTFDNEQYQKALNYLQGKSQVQSSHQDPRLYPESQPEVFKRLFGLSNSTTRLDKHLSELQSMNKQQWIYKLDNMNYLSKEARTIIETDGLVKTMNKLIKMGAKRQSQLKTSDQHSFMKISGIKHSQIYREQTNIPSQSRSTGLEYIQNIQQIKGRGDVPNVISEHQELKVQKRKSKNYSLVSDNHLSHVNSTRMDSQTIASPENKSKISNALMQTSRLKASIKTRNNLSNERAESTFKKSQRLVNNRTALMQGFLQSLETRAKYERNSVQMDEINMKSANFLKDSKQGIRHQSFVSPTQANINIEIQSPTPNMTILDEGTSIFNQRSLMLKRMSHQMPRSIGRIIKDIDQKNKYETSNSTLNHGIQTLQNLHQHQQNRQSILNNTQTSQTQPMTPILNKRIIHRRVL
eukprot:403373728